MSKVKADITMSLDGFIAGPYDGAEHPLGVGGERLHQWIYDLESWRQAHGLEGGVSNRDDEIMDEAFRNVGAVVIGKSMFICGERPWGDTPPFHTLVFVATHNARANLVKDGGTTFIFVTDGVESAVRQAQAAAVEQDVSVAGGGNVLQQLLKAGLIDEIQIHIVPVLLGEGRKLFDHLGADHIELECTRVIASPDVTHLKFRPIKSKLER